MVKPLSQSSLKKTLSCLGLILCLQPGTTFAGAAPAVISGEQPVLKKSDVKKTAAALDKAAYAVDVCTLIRTHAEEAKLPVEFFTRLIWRESYFNADAVSPAGAEGIAQFMPGTAKLRGLKDSFNHREALAASGQYLGYLRSQYGNLGLAAAAYNAGEGAVGAWLAGKRGFMPVETEDYVLAVTGHSLDEWRLPTTQLDIPDLGGKEKFDVTCKAIVMREQLPKGTTLTAGPRAPIKPWGAMLAGGFSESRTLRSFGRIKQRFGAVLKDELPLVTHKRNLSRGRRALVRVMVGRNSRQEAEKLCGTLRQAGAACMVAKN